MDIINYIENTNIIGNLIQDVILDRYDDILIKNNIIHRQYDNINIYYFIDPDNAIEILSIENININERGKGYGSKALTSFIKDFNNYTMYLYSIPERVNWYKKFGFNIYSLLDNNEILMLREKG